MFTAVCVVLSAAGHAVGSGRPLPWWTLAAGFAVVLAAAGPLAGRERSVPGIAVGLALGQAALHTLFGLAQHYCTAPRTGGSDRVIALAARITCNDGPVPPSPAEARRIVHAAGIDPSAHSGHGAAHDAVSSSFSSLLPSLPMLLGHLLAAVVLGLLLSRGDAALVRLIRLSASSVADEALARALRAAVTLLRSVRAGLPVAPVAFPRAPLAHRRNRTGPGSAELDHSVARRGPPVYALAA